MPTRPKRPCPFPGCPELTDGPCAAHRRVSRRHTDERRGSSSERGYGSRWRRYRLEYLKANPLCVDCLEIDRTTPATDLDHVKPHNGDPVLFWDPQNHRGRCHSHHSSKTASHDGGFGNVRRAVGSLLSRLVGRSSTPELPPEPASPDAKMHTHETVYVVKTPARRSS